MKFELQQRLVYGGLGSMFGLMAGIGSAAGMLVQAGAFLIVICLQVEFIKDMEASQRRSPRQKKGWPW